MSDFIFRFKGPNDEIVEEHVRIDDPKFAESLFAASRTKDQIATCLNCGWYVQESVLLSGEDIIVLH